MPGRIRIRCADAHRNIAYISRGEDHRVRCMLSNGVLASFFYAGILSDEMAARFALEDCRTPEAALEVVRRLGSRTFQYSLVEEPPVQPEPSIPEPACVYLRLFHGRRDPEADLEERGSEGPVIGPLAFVQVTYLCDVKFAAAPEVMERFFPDVISDWRSRGLANAKAPLLRLAPRCRGRPHPLRWHLLWRLVGHGAGAGRPGSASGKKKTTRRWP